MAESECVYVMCGDASIERRDGVVHDDVMRVDKDRFHLFARFEGIEAWCMERCDAPFQKLLDVRLPFPLCERVYPDPVVWRLTSHHPLESFWDTRIVRTRTNLKCMGISTGESDDECEESDGDEEEEVAYDEESEEEYQSDGASQKTMSDSEGSDIFET